MKAFDRWSELLYSEFRMQAKEEESLGLTPAMNPYNDFQKASMQVNFLQGFVLVFFKELRSIEPHFSDYVKNIEKNITEWKSKLKKS